LGHGSHLSRVEGVNVRYFSEPLSESFVFCSERIVLECGCGEKLVLLGLEEDWRSEKTVFECECGAELTLVDRIDEKATYIRRLLYGSIKAI
jgi:hypothetical protein